VCVCCVRAVRSRADACALRVPMSRSKSANLGDLPLDFMRGSLGDLFRQYEIGLRILIPLKYSIMQAKRDYDTGLPYSRVGVAPSTISSPTLRPSLKRTASR